MKKRKRSDEEEQFAAWLKEGEEHGLIYWWHEQTPTFPLIPRQAIVVEKQLKTKKKLVEKFLFHPLTYTADFSFSLTEKGYDLLANVFATTFAINRYCNGYANKILVDTKGEYTPQHAQSEAFEIKRKLVFQLHKRYVEKVVPYKRRGKGLFQMTYAPEKYRWWKNKKKLTVIGETCRPIEEFVR